MRKKIAVLVLTTILGAGSMAHAESSAVQSKQEVPEVSKEVSKNPYGKPVQVKTTAYCRCSLCCGHDHGITKSGRKAVEGLTVASNVYYGKTVVLYDEDLDYIGIYECMDTGTDGLDIYMDSHQEALEFGVHYYYIQAVDAVG